MRAQTLFKVAVLTGLLALSGCASKITQPDKYSGFLKDYSGLKETKSATGQPVLRWVDPNFNESKYDNIVYNPITYYPVPKPTTQVGQQVLDKLLSYTNTQMKTALAKRKPLVTTPGSRSLIFRGQSPVLLPAKKGCSSMKWSRLHCSLRVRKWRRGTVPWTRTSFSKVS